MGVLEYLLILMMIGYHHQFKYLVLHGVHFLIIMELDLLEDVGQLKLMEHFGDGEEIIMEDWD